MNAVTGASDPSEDLTDPRFVDKPSALPASTKNRIARELAEALAREGCLLTGRNTAVALRHQMEQYPTIVTLDGDDVIGFATLWLVGTRGVWAIYELGSVWIHPSRRGGTLSHRLYREIMRLRRNLVDDLPGAVVFSITTNPKAVRLGLEVGFLELEIAEWHARLPWEVTCGPCDLVAESEKPCCPRRCADCRLRIIPPANP